MLQRLLDFGRKVSDEGLIATTRYAIRRVIGSSDHLGRVSADDARQSYPIESSEIPVPNLELMKSIGADSVKDFLFAGELWSNLLEKHFTTSTSVLDIGCGCGRVARFLAENPKIESYIGFDTIKALIDWNNEYIIPHCAGSFEFSHMDIYSKAYNPTGVLRASQIVFPAKCQSIDIAFAASLFTHLLENDAQHYLSEIFRVLKPGGHAFLSILATNEKKVAYTGNEFRIEALPSHFKSMAAKAGLTLFEDLGDINGQRIFVFQKSR